MRAKTTCSSAPQLFVSEIQVVMEEGIKGIVCPPGTRHIAPFDGGVSVYGFLDTFLVNHLNP
jgi:hypothetical protein